MSVPHIPGVRADGEMLHMIRAEVAQLLRRNHTTFPGAQPVSFASQHLTALQKQDYYLCEKTDGLRCLLFCTTGNTPDLEAHWLIDRKNDYYYVEGLHLPTQEKFPSGFHTNTLFDGELTMDRIKQPDGRMEERLVYYVFDCLVIDGTLITDRTLDKRLARYDNFVQKPLQRLEKEYAGDVVALFPFRMKMKKMEKPYGAEMMFREVLPRLPHGNDGLIFTCRDSPYVFGTDEKILKWKPAHENSIDFRLRLGKFPTMEVEFEEDGSVGVVENWDAKPTIDLEVFHGGKDYRTFASLYVTDQEWEAMKAINQHLDERIIECFKDDEGRWRYKREPIDPSNPLNGESDSEDDPKSPPNYMPRFRDDKNSANHISTVNKVLESIEDAVSAEDLIRASRLIHKAWKERHPEEEAAKRAAVEKQKRDSTHRADGPRPNGQGQIQSPNVTHRDSLPQRTGPPPND